MNCLFCNNKNIKTLKGFNLLPRCFDFQKKANSSSGNYKILLLQCYNCTVIQLRKTGDKNSFKTKFDWIENKEPDQHLINLSNYIEKFLKKGKRVLFLSKYDQVIFNHLKKKYHKSIYILNNKDLNIKHRNISQFFIQDKLVRNILIISSIA